jgi:hypothetical protein
MLMQPMKHGRITVMNTLRKRLYNVISTTSLDNMSCVGANIKTTNEPGVCVDAADTIGDLVRALRKIQSASEYYKTSTNTDLRQAHGVVERLCTTVLDRFTKGVIGHE